MSAKAQPTAAALSDDAPEGDAPESPVVAQARSGGVANHDRPAANDAPKSGPPDFAAATGRTGGPDAAAAVEARNNVVKRTVDEVVDLMAEVHEIREELLAHGVQFHMLNALIELGVHDKPAEQAKMMATAVEASIKAHGQQAITPDELAQHLDEIITLEKDLRHVRHVAGQQGIHMQALNHLTQLMRLNPGDRGVQAINTFVAYADAAGVDLGRVSDVLAKFDEEPESVLPVIDRDALHDGKSARVELAQQLAVGVLLTIVVMWLVL